MHVIILARKRRRPYVTYLLILVNVIVYILTSLQNSLVETSSEWIDTLAYMPSLTGCPREWYRFLSCMFTHADFMHIFFNMYFLFIFGREVETRLGHLKYLVLYLLAGLGATAFHTAFTPVSGSIGLVIPTVGASGAISGILASHMLMFPGRKLAAWIFPLPPVVISSGYYLLIWFTMQVLYGYTKFESGTAFFAHAGGFVVGILVLYLLRHARKPRPEIGRTGLGAKPKAILGLVIVALAAGAVYSYFTSKNLTGVYLLSIHTIRNGHPTEDVAVYTMVENKTVSPSSDDPRVVFNRIVWAGLLQYQPSYTNPDFEDSTTVFPPSLWPPLRLYMKGSISYDQLGVLQSFEGKMITDVILTDSYGRVRSVEKNVEYQVSMNSEEVAGDLGAKVVGPLALLSAAVAVGALIVTLTKSDELLAREVYLGFRPLIPI
jgi:membrane associated rhomboid family serine protease